MSLPIDSSDRSFADEQTLSDLNVFPSDAGGMSLYQLFDRTRTSSGRLALRSFLAKPKTTVAEIEATQETLRYFSDAANRALWDFRASDRGMGYLEKYLESHIHPLHGRRSPVYWVRGMWYRANYQKYYEHLDSCVRRSHRYFLGLTELVERVSADLPAQLETQLETLQELLNEPIVQQILKVGGNDSRFWFWDVFYFDQYLRGDLRPLLRSALDSCYEIDAWKAIGIVTEDRDLRFPRFVPDSHLRAEGVWHPFLDQAVANDLAMDSDRNFALVTGPNMAGKTTFMKSLGICVYLAHLGMPVPAASLELPLFDGLCSSLNVLDNIEKGYSYYFTEVDRVKTVAERLSNGERIFVLFDELFKGTNIKDALDGSTLVIKGFLRFPESLFLVSSHLIELKDSLGDDSRIQYVSFESEVVDGVPKFSYRLVPGVSQERLGLLILENAGVGRLLRGEGSAEPTR